MLNKANDRWKLLVDVAFGDASKEALGELRNDEPKKLEQLERIVGFYRTRVEHAPEHAIARAIDIMPSKSKRLVFNSPLQFGFAGAREANPEYHVLYQQDGVRLRMMYLPLDSGYEIMGQISPTNWLIVSEDQAIETSEDGRFSMQVDALKHPPLLLLSDQTSIEVMSAGDLNAGQS